MKNYTNIKEIILFRWNGQLDENGNKELSEYKCLQQKTYFYENIESFNMNNALMGILTYDTLKEAEYDIFNDIDEYSWIYIRNLHKKNIIDKVIDKIKN